ncbi:ABC transporter permease [Phytoactinopolyspora limicola]|uniref:ABC transporter permease n=1 Tax=Phytoactinopolyspora limicola TaxID=2715536 RepID=UPI001408768C|nr:ABC transporter permease [Phytoactinopolyspora limicola]
MRSWLHSYKLLLKWNALRMRAEIPVFLALQTVIASGIVIGFSLLIPEIDAVSALYLTTGAMTVSLITVGTVLAPQIVAQQKERGLLDYQRSMPVPRLAMLAADATIWILVALPGLVATLFVAILRFDLQVSMSPWLVLAVPLVSAGSVAVGYCIAYTVKPVLVGLVTNIVMIAALMFAPVNYPAERLPEWARTVHDWLPFQYMAQAIRDTIDVPAGGTPLLPFVVLVAWAIIGLAITSRVMTRRI